VYDPTQASAPIVNGFVGGEFENFESFNPPPGGPSSHLTSGTLGGMANALSDFNAVQE